ncbi:hypothetical protein PCE1_000489 [Barthelona sp. PCE]
MNTPYVSSVRSSPYTCCKIDPSLTLIAAGSSDGSLGVYDFDLKLRYALTGHHRGVTCLTFNPVSHHLVLSGSDDCHAILWDLRKKQAVFTARGHNSYILDVDFHPHGSVFATASNDETVCLWDVRSGNKLRTLEAHTDAVNTVNFSRDGTCLLTSSYEGHIRIWETSTGRCLQTLLNDGTGPCSFASFSPNEKYCLVGTTEEVSLWDLRGELLRKLPEIGRSDYLTNSVFVDAPGTQFGNDVWCVIGVNEDDQLVLVDVDNNAVLETATLDFTPICLDMVDNSLVVCGFSEQGKGYLQCYETLFE